MNFTEKKSRCLAAGIQKSSLQEFFRIVLFSGDFIIIIIIIIILFPVNQNRNSLHMKKLDNSSKCKMQMLIKSTID